jgi:hypothetical protein
MSGSATRDWLLDKLMKLRQAMTEMKFDYEGQLGLMRLRHGDQLKEAQERAARAENNLKDFREDWQEMRDRVLQLSTSKGYKVVYRGGFETKLDILAVNHCNGETVITVQRAL